MKEFSWRDGEKIYAFFQRINLLLKMAGVNFQVKSNKGNVDHKQNGKMTMRWGIFKTSR